MSSKKVDDPGTTGGTTAGTTTSPRRRLTPSQRKDAILDVAVGLLAREDASELTINEVAQRASVSRATFYRAFSSLQDVRAAILERVADAFTKKMFSGFGSDNQWDELSVGIRDFIDTVMPLRREVLSLLESQSNSTIAEKMKDAIADEVVRRVLPVEVTDLGRSMLAAWIAAAEHQLKHWLHALPDGHVSKTERGQFGHRLALMLVGMAQAFAETSDDAFIAEVLRILEEGRRSSKL